MGTHGFWRGGAPATLAVLGLMAVPAAAEKPDLEFVIQGKLQPTYFSNFDLDSNVDDPATATSAGAVDVGDEHVRAEIRYGAIAKGEDWSAKLILENDFSLDANTVDRAFRGERWGLERAYFTYQFNPALVLQAGWEFKNLDLASGGMLYGDDHPLFGVMGDTSWGGYDVYWMPIINGLSSGGSGFLGGTEAEAVSGDLDWDVFAGKLDFDLGAAGRLSPMVAYSDNEQFDNTATWFGAEYVGSFGLVNVRAEGLGVLGSFDGGQVKFRDGVIVPAGAANLDGDDIAAFAAYVAAEVPINEAFNPYVSFRWNSGDDDPFDDDVGGWLGITDVARFSPLYGLNGQFLGWQPAANPALSSLLFGLALDDSGPAGGNGLAPENGATYGGIQNGGTGLNPGQIMLAVGSSGSLAAISPKLSYHAQVFAMWYDTTAGLEVLPGAKADVATYAGTEVDAEIKWQFNENFSSRLVGSVFVPGQGVKDATGADDVGGLGMLELLWTY